MSVTHIKHTMVPNGLFYYLVDSIALYEMHTGKKPKRITIPNWRESELNSSVPGFHLVDFAIDEAKRKPFEDYMVCGIPLMLCGCPVIQLTQ